MSRLLMPARIDAPWELAELVSGAIGEIISGGVLIDAGLGNKEFGYFDLLAANEDGEGVFFFINASGDEKEYLRLLKCMRWYQENRDTLQKLHAGRVALGPAPPVFVVAPSYSHSMLKVLLNIRDAGVTLLKYVCFEDSTGEKSLFIEKVSDSPADTGRAVSMQVPGPHPSVPAAERLQMQQAEKIMYLRELRREMANDISNVSDEELLDLFG